MVTDLRTSTKSIVVIGVAKGTMRPWQYMRIRRWFLGDTSKKRVQRNGKEIVKTYSSPGRWGKEIQVCKLTQGTFRIPREIWEQVKHALDIELGLSENVNYEVLCVGAVNEAYVNRRDTVKGKNKR